LAWKPSSGQSYSLTFDEKLHQTRIDRICRSPDARTLGRIWIAGKLSAKARVGFMLRKVRIRAGRHGCADLSDCQPGAGHGVFSTRDVSESGDGGFLGCLSLAIRTSCALKTGDPLGNSAVARHSFSRTDSGWVYFLDRFRSLENGTSYCFDRPAGWTLWFGDAIARGSQTTAGERA
jgi:hypothetical protein